MHLQLSIFQHFLAFFASLIAAAAVAPDDIPTLIPMIRILTAAMGWKIMIKRNALKKGNKCSNIANLPADPLQVPEALQFQMLRHLIPKTSEP